MSEHIDISKVEELKDLIGKNPTAEEFGEKVYECISTPLLLRTLARTLEQKIEIDVSLLCKQIIKRMETLITDK